MLISRVIIKDEGEGSTAPARVLLPYHSWNLGTYPGRYGDLGGKANFWACVKKVMNYAEK